MYSWKTIAYIGLAAAFSTMAMAADKVSIIEFVVPPHVKLHQEAMLTCRHDLGGQKLMTVSWFLNDKEFYRYSFEDSQPIKNAYENVKFTVYKAGSNQTHLVLRNLSLEATGQYKCKIETDEPKFDTDEKKANLQVVVIPDEKPTMEGMPKKPLLAGAKISINCTSPASIPAATLSFRLNNVEVHQKFIPKQIVVENKDGLFVTTATLKKALKKSDFKEGKADITCFSRIKTFGPSTSSIVVKGNAATIRNSCALWIVVLVIALTR